MDPDQALAAIIEVLADRAAGRMSCDRDGMDGMGPGMGPEVGDADGESEDVPLAEATGRILARPLIGAFDHPPAAMSAMDGYAVRCADLAKAPLSLDLIGESRPGQRPDGHLPTGTAMPIFTGAPLPAGADAIVIKEDATRKGMRIHIRKTVSCGAYVRGRGMDFRRGDTGLQAGILLRPHHIALAAAMNYPRIRVRRPIDIAILSLGDELVLPGSRLTASQIVASSLSALKSMMACPAIRINDLGIVADDRDRVIDMLDRAGGDLIVTTGGASVGDYDMMRRILNPNNGGANDADANDRGVSSDKNRMIVDKVAMRPGKPTMFAIRNNVPILALPGNPVSAFVCGYFFLEGAMRALLRLRCVAGSNRKAKLTRPLAKAGARAPFERATIKGYDGDYWLVEPMDNQDSSLVSRLAACDVIIRRPAHAPAIGKGAIVDVMRLTPFPDHWGSAVQR